ncbi:MAG TPA: TonB-dependent receptor [Nitrospiria bacterium]|nr:TonB-dependent receptor [Nitrospiria bacterium]
MNRWSRGVLCLLGMVAFAQGVHAQQPKRDADIVVTATRLPTPAAEVASSVTVITREEIERKQQRTLADVLRDVPGLSLVQTGGPGGLTSVFMRGTNANHTKVFIDGIDVGDPSSAGGDFDFAHLPAEDVERVEVLRGPQSGLYGSDAIGGVINVVTKRRSGATRLTVGVESGSFGTFNQTGSASGAVSRLHYALDVGHLHSGDTPVTPQDLLPTGRNPIGDFYDNKTVSAKLGAGLTDSFEMDVVARYIDTELRFTGEDFSTFPSSPAAEQSQADTGQFFTRGTAHALLFDGALDQTLGVAYTRHYRRYLSPDTGLGPVDPVTYRGNRIKWDWQGNLFIAATQILTLGAESQREEITTPVSAEATTNAGFLQMQSSLDKRLFSTISLRYDDHDRFGGETTYRIAPAMLMRGTGTKLKGSVGTGFKAPALDQLFHDYPAFGFFANPDLKPEESFGYDLGFEQALTRAHVQVGATYFHNDVDNLITINNAGTSYANVAEATTSGVETFLAHELSDRLSWRADYTYTKAEDAVSGEELLRRPKHKASVDARWQVTDAGTLSATVLYVGSRIDRTRDFTVPRFEAAGYTIVNLAGSYDLSRVLMAFARIENLFNREYEDPIGFLRPGFGAFAGVQAVLGGTR